MNKVNKYTQLIHGEDIFAGFNPPFQVEIETNNLKDDVKLEFFDNINQKIKDQGEVVFLEIGTFKGASSLEIALYFKKNNINGHVLSLDHFHGSIFHWENEFWRKQLKIKHGFPNLYYQFLSNICHFQCQDIITPIPFHSNDAAEFLKNKGIKIDYLYIDGCHTYQSVTNDANNYLPLLNNDGRINFDDIDIGWPDSVRAANDFIERNKRIIKSTKQIKSQLIVKF